MLVTQLCPTLWDLLNCSPLGSSVLRILQTRILEWVALPTPEDLPDTGIKSGSPTLQVDCLLSEPPGKPMGWICPLKFLCGCSNPHYVRCDNVWRRGESCSVVSDSCDPMDSNPIGSYVHGILQASILGWVAMPFSRGFSRSRDWTCIASIAGTLCCLNHQGSPFKTTVKLKWGHVGGAVILYDWCPYMKRSGHRNTQEDNHVKTQEKAVSTHPGEGPQEEPALPTLISQPLPSRTLKNKHLLLEPPSVVCITLAQAG